MIAGPEGERPFQSKNSKEKRILWDRRGAYLFFAALDYNLTLILSKGKDWKRKIFMHPMNDRFIKPLLGFETFYVFYPIGFTYGYSYLTPLG